MSIAVLDIQGLKTQFATKRGLVSAVDGLDLTIQRRETVCIVGESGCGKSVTALSILRLIPKPQGNIAAGKVLFHQQDLLQVSETEIRKIRGDRISMIFQEPMTSLNPVYTIGFQIQEVLRKHRKMTKKQAREAALDMLNLVGIPEPKARIDDYPHQLSGGMRQRVMIAMALSCHPELIIADEPTTALDVTIQAQILDLMNSLKKEIGMAVLLITHDLGVVAETAQYVAVMYAGKIVEQAPVKSLFAEPLHPYTVGLFDSLPQIGGSQGRLKPIPGVVPSLIDLPPGCAFQARCFRAQIDCQQTPPWIAYQPGHWFRCWHPME
ncbi:oligopeptide/dipeptide ABC transporter, ATPase subunit [Candidatus Vecturithrix granuli]|uniref:Oligopeptide/dipeptide ABC transporter, ATPase subunit n=1 Tax=Vecturithrix granuli TaxID=1499967 RepID=A0A081C0N9_VECG1|nr:oligopeptide/dipeptide ABC transporter, ATPase subunit [Candidatus Vecturithrix granuli]